MNIVTPSSIRIVLSYINTKPTHTHSLSADTLNMQRLQYNRRTCRIKTAQRQLDLTGDNTPIHHHAPGDSTTLHSDSRQQSTHTHTCTHAHRCVTKSANTKHTTAHVSITTNLTGLLVCCVCTRLYPHILFICMRAHE